MLEHPGIWDQDVLNPNSEKPSPDIWMRQEIFTDNFLNQLLVFAVRNYFMLSCEEVTLWNEDSLKFFIDMKEESNENKGAILRDRAKRLVAGVELRFCSIF